MQCRTSLQLGIPRRSPAAAAAVLSFRRSLAPLSFPSLSSYPRHHHHHLHRVPFRPHAMRKRNPKPASQKLYEGEEQMLYVEMDPSGADSWKLEPVVELIGSGAVGVIPTDTIYAIVCDMRSHSSIERLRRIKGIERTKPLSVLCRSLRDIDIYTTGFPRGNDHGQTNIFRAAKHILPGPYTFILPASKALPKQCIRHGRITKFVTRKTVGVRMPDDAICQGILGMLNGPLISTSVKWPTADRWMLDPVQIADIYEPEGLDFIVNGGVRVADPSTVVDLTGSTPIIIRQGKGPKYDWMEEMSEDTATDGTNAVLVPNAAEVLI